MEISESNDAETVICADCGAQPFEGKDCQKLFEEALVQDFNDHRYAKVHRLMVDAYALQHPDRYMRSGKSFAAHLAGMCAALEHEDGPLINKAVQRWLDGPELIDRPTEIPKSPGDLNITHIGKAGDPNEHVKLVKEWAHTVWSAWSEYHDLARGWIDKAVESGKHV